MNKKCAQIRPSQGEYYKYEVLSDSNRYESIFYVNPAFQPYLRKDSRTLRVGIDKREKAELAIFLFLSSQKNLPLIGNLKLQGTKVVYIFHEPLAPMIEYRKAGLSYRYWAKLWVINRISALTVKWSDLILLPSMNAVEFYENNPLYTNKHYY